MRMATSAEVLATPSPALISMRYSPVGRLARGTSTFVTPGATPAKNAEYGDLLQRYTSDATFRDLVKAVTVTGAGGSVSETAVPLSDDTASPTAALKRFRNEAAGQSSSAVVLRSRSKRGQFASESTYVSNRTAKHLDRSAFLFVGCRRAATWADRRTFP